MGCGSLLTAGMLLDDVVLVECASGCGHRRPEFNKKGAAITFARAYRELEAKFKARVDLDQHIHGVESVFLPNVEPTGQVDYVLVGMEPGLSGMDLKTAKDEIDACKRENWGRCPQKSTVVFAVWKYLCDKGKTKYYFTDLAHGAMSAKSKDAKDQAKIDRAKYERWYPLFEEELALVAKPNAKIISIGHTACRFLAEKGLQGHAGMVAHPSPQGLGRAGKEIPTHKVRWEKFLQDTAAKDTDQFPKKVNKTKTCAQQRLVFDYMITFERILNQEETGWVARSREWERRLF